MVPSPHKMSNAFRRFERDVADKAISDDHVNPTSVDIASFDVSDEVDRKLLQQIECFAREFVALAFFFANGEQADAWLLHSKHAAEINVAHDGELFQVVSFTVNVGADVE